MNKLILSLLAVVVLAAGCSSSKSDKGSTTGKLSFSTEDSALRPLTPSEREQDYNQMILLFKSYYAPYQYKEKVIGVAFDKMAEKFRAEAINAASDEEFAGVVMKLGATLRDGHVQIITPNTASKIARYVLPMMVESIENKAIVVEITKEAGEFSGIQVGDEVVSMDGRTAQELWAEVIKYRRTGTEVSDLRFMANIVSRPSYMSSLIPKKSMASLVVKHIDGSQTQIDIPWETRKYVAQGDKMAVPAGKFNFLVSETEEFRSVVNANINKMGAVDPFFWSEKIRSTYRLVKVYPSDLYRTKYGLKADEKPPIFAALYNYKGKTILLVRSATYYPEDFKPAIYMKAYQALLEEYETLADVLVLDQTHNPGGSYCGDFYELFGKPGDAQSVQQCRADRTWINGFTIDYPAELNQKGGDKDYTLDIRTSIALGLEVEKAYDNGSFLSAPVPLFTGFKTVQNSTYKWTKPMLLITDENAGSCGDLFPMLVKLNKRAKIFGQQTMGLGGNVEEVGKLPHSQILVRMTRGLFHPYRADGQYKPEDYIENNGVTPDYPYSHTVSDFRNGYIGYVKAFSDKALEQIPAN